MSAVILFHIFIWVRPGQEGEAVLLLGFAIKW